MCELFEEPLIVITTSAGGVRVSVSGDVDVAVIAVLREALDAAIARGAGDVDVDMSGTTFCDSVGLYALLTARDELCESGRRLRIVNASSAVSRLLYLSGIRELFIDPFPASDPTVPRHDGPPGARPR